MVRGQLATFLSDSNAAAIRLYLRGVLTQATDEDVATQGYLKEKLDEAESNAGATEPLDWADSAERQ